MQLDILLLITNFGYYFTFKFKFIKDKTLIRIV